MIYQLKSLLERVEKAEGPDRELDFDIARWQGWTQHTDEADPVYRNQISTWWKEPQDKDWSATSYPPYYTASIDTAVALVEKKLPGWDYLVCRISGGPAGAEVGPPDSFQQIKADGATPALALIAALLRAFIAEQGE